MRSLGLGLVLLFVSVLTTPQEARAQQFVGCANVQQITRVECEALQALYDNTDGLNWLVRTGWVRANQPCTWHGVRCEGISWPLNVVSIRLPNNDLRGNLPGELVNLKYLRELVLDNRTNSGSEFRRMTGSIPDVFGDFESLEVLDLGHNAIPADIPAELGKIATLRELRLDGNALTGNIPATLGDATALEIIDVSHNELSGLIPVQFGNLTALTVLRLNNNGLLGPIPGTFANLKRLQILDLGHNILYDPIPTAALAGLDSLFRLDLSHNQLDGTFGLALAELGQSLSFCQAEQNRSVCLPDRPAFRSLTDAASICGLPFDAACPVCHGEPSDAGTCEVLGTLFEQTQGSVWQQRDGWLTTSDPCQWYGVGCEGATVTSIRLPQNGLSGVLPNALAEMSGLHTLDLRGNDLRGPLPLTLAAAFADLGQCNLTTQSSLCLPDTPAYQLFLSGGSVCGLAPDRGCSDQGVWLSVEASTGADGTLQLSWALADLDAGGSFRLERRVGEAFVPSEAQTTLTDLAAGRYRFDIDGLNPGTHVLRVQHVLADGSISTSPEVEVFVIDARGLTLSAPYPNPSRDRITVTAGSTTDRQLDVRLYDALGREVRLLDRLTLRAGTPLTRSFSVGALPPGLYFIRAATFTQALTVLP
ncbi:MAG: T9SS type A sorting domain-containing protein [Bacteroidota bacterium]